MIWIAREQQGLECGLEAVLRGLRSAAIFCRDLAASVMRTRDSALTPSRRSEKIEMNSGSTKEPKWNLECGNNL